MPNRFNPRGSKVFQAMCGEALRQLVADTAGVESACLVTGDGFEIASALNKGVSAARLAAMTSSMHALGTAVTTELKMKECKSVIVDGESGTVVMVRVPSHHAEMMLAVTCGKRGTIGGVLFAAKQHARWIDERLTATAQ
jgi:uncharacterized protein